MKKGIFIFVGILWLVLLYIAQIIAHILNKLSNSNDKQKLFSDPSQLYSYPVKHPIGNIINLISEQNKVFLVLLVLITILSIYVLIRQMIEGKDGNKDNQDYKIAKHGSHGSARFADDNELFNEGHYKKIKEDDVVNYVKRSLNTSILKERSDDDDNDIRRT